MPNINLVYYLIAGVIFEGFTLKTGIPAAPLAGALVGASILSISGRNQSSSVANWNENNIRNWNLNCYWYIVD